MSKCTFSFLTMIMLKKMISNIFEELFHQDFWILPRTNSTENSTITRKTKLWWSNPFLVHDTHTYQEYHRLLPAVNTTTWCRDAIARNCSWRRRRPSRSCRWAGRSWSWRRLDEDRRGKRSTSPCVTPLPIWAQPGAGFGRFCSLSQIVPTLIPIFF